MYADIGASRDNIYDSDVNENVTKQYDLMSITIVQLVRYVFWYISFLLSAKQQREMTKSQV